jgi:hypothetical protein
MHEADRVKSEEPDRVQEHQGNEYDPAHKCFRESSGMFRNFTRDAAPASRYHNHSGKNQH